MNEPLSKFDNPAVDTPPPSSDWLNDALKALEAMEKLPEDWDSSGAEPPSPLAIRNCQSVLTQLAEVDLKPSLIEPSTDDAVCVGFWAANRFADIECFNDGDMLAMIHDRGNAEPEIWEFRTNDLPRAIEKIQSFLQK